MLAVWDGSLLEAQASVASTVPKRFSQAVSICLNVSILIFSLGSGLIEGHGGFT